MLFTLVLSFQEYFWFSVTRLYLMYKLHRYEFNRHACNLISMYSIILFSLVYQVCGFYTVTVIAACVQVDYNLDYDDPSDLEKLNEMADVCHSTFTFDILDHPQSQAALVYFIFIVASLLPFLSYFWLHEPHDCFTCVGKDPDRRYSIFQLTRRENLILEHQVQYGGGAFGIVGNLSNSNDKNGSSSSVVHL